ncbi:MAG: glycosyltransferase family 39 protein [Verrucomicrobia bacterium]|nr:glycosyltransferase family 39 protein [Verrucomicrobiota bacterium]
MATPEETIQGFVHSLEQGWLAAVFRTILLIVLVCALGLAYLLIQFRGLSTQDGIDEAQIARQIAQGQGFSTKNIRPLAIHQLEKYTGRIPTGAFPETYHAPLNPLVEALAIKLFPRALGVKIDNARPVYAGDRLIGAISILFFILSLIITFFIGWDLFDRRVALIGVGLTAVADQFWQVSLSGLPQMLLLFLFSCACWCSVKALRAQVKARFPILVLLGLGISLGLMTLTHPAMVWIALGFILFCLVYIRPRFISVLVPGVICGGLFSVWVLHQYQTTKTPFGISPYACLDGVGLSHDTWMRQSQPDSGLINILAIRRRALEEIKSQLGSIYALLGGIFLAPVFFVSLLHKFKRAETAQFRWGLLLFWLLAFAGSALLGTGGKTIHPNQFHILFGPIMTLYGVAFILVLWSRLGFNTPLLRSALLAGLFMITGFPSLLGFLSSSPSPIQFPPYLPSLMQLFGTWTQPNEIISSDMPWAIGWYSDRKSLWLPYTTKPFYTWNDYQSLGGPIVGLYLTPVSRDLPFASNIQAGDFGQWAAVLIPIREALTNFPLKGPLVLANGQCLYYSDRERWNEGQTQGTKQ